jgi:hypothetical protein
MAFPSVLNPLIPEKSALESAISYPFISMGYNFRKMAQL